MSEIRILYKSLENASSLKKYLRSQLPRIGVSLELSEISPYDEDQFLQLLIGALRGEECGQRSEGNDIIILTRDDINCWFQERVRQNTILISHEHEETYHLTIFALTAACQMWTGGTQMTVTEFSRRGKRRPLLQIVADIFTGKIGEVATRRLARNLGYEVQPDWDLSPERERYRSDLTRIGRVGEGRLYEAPGVISVKSTASLTGAWAEAPTGAHIALFWKIALPEDFLLRLLQYISSWTKLIKFLNERVGQADPFKNFLQSLSQIESGLSIPCYFEGFYRPSQDTLRSAGEELPFLGKVREGKHMCRTGQLQWSQAEFRQLMEQIYQEAKERGGR